MRSRPALAVGSTMPLRSIGPLTPTDIVRFAGAGGDFNPLHHVDSVARAAGFDGVIAMGQFQAAALAGALSDWAGVESVLRYEVRFASPWSAGETLDLSGEVTAAVDWVAEVQLSGAVGDRVVITGSARVAVA